MKKTKQCIILKYVLALAQVSGIAIMLSEKDEELWMSIA